MRNKKTFSFDEERDGQELYNTGFPNGNIDYSKMYLIAKYIRQTYDFGEIRLEKELIRYCQAQNKNFNPILEASAIKKWIRSAMNYDLRKIDSVIISQKEIDFLKNIKNNRDRKLLFIILVFSKALKKSNVKRNKKNIKTSQNYYIHYSNFADIIRLSKLNNISEVDLADILHEYKEYFTFYNAERELIRVNFVDNCIKKSIIIDNMDNITNYFPILFEEHKPASTCIICGKPIKKNSNIQKYCKECAKNIKREQLKNLMRKRRSVIK